MYAWVDAERFAGLTLDAALRVLLSNFRLPGVVLFLSLIMQPYTSTCSQLVCP